MSGWLRNNWYCASYSEDVPVASVVSRVVCGEHIVLWRGEDGVIRALEDRCPHRYAPLSLGKAIGADRIRCNYHGLQFDGRGQCVHNPHGKGLLPKSANLRSYCIHEYCGMVWIWMGEAAPDPALLPDLSIFLPTSGYPLGGRGSLQMEVPFELVVDNLMDLSHAALLHEGLLGNEQSLSAETESGEEEDGRVFARRLMRNIDPPEYLDLIWRNDGQKIDMWHDVTWQPTATVFLDVGATGPGMSKEEGSGVYAQHVITPMTPTSCLYFFMSARRNPPLRSAEEDRRIQARLLELRRKAFAEQDAPMIRAQYATILRSKEYKPHLLGIDKATALWRRRIAALLKNEVAPSSLAETPRPGGSTPR